MCPPHRHGTDRRSARILLCVCWGGWLLVCGLILPFTAVTSVVILALLGLAVLTLYVASLTGGL